MSDVDDMDYSILDPGIRDLVRWCRQMGLETSDSGDGVSKPAEWYERGEAIRIPHVVGVGSQREIIRLAIKFHHALKPYPHDKTIEVSWQPIGCWMLTLMGFTNEDVPRGV